jgi:hypothetical protein
MKPIVNLGFENLHLTASLLAQASWHEKRGNNDAAQSILRTIESFHTEAQSKLEQEASIRRAVREVSRW